MKGIEGGAAREVRSAQALIVSAGHSRDLTAAVGPMAGRSGARSAGAGSGASHRARSQGGAGGADSYPVGARHGGGRPGNSTSMVATNKRSRPSRRRTSRVRPRCRWSPNSSASAAPLRPSERPSSRPRSAAWIRSASSRTRARQGAAGPRVRSLRARRHGGARATPSRPHARAGGLAHRPADPRSRGAERRGGGLRAGLGAARAGSPRSPGAGAPSVDGGNAASSPMFRMAASLDQLGAHVSTRIDSTRAEFLEAIEELTAASTD